MEPQLPTPREIVTPAEQGVDTYAPGNELGGNNLPSHQEQMIAAPPIVAPISQQSSNPVAVVDPAAQSTLSAPQQQSNPVVADDVDVIEKEWVDKAKKIVSATKDDPYNQEKQVSKLQADYLMKRYGKQIKTVD